MEEQVPVHKVFISHHHANDQQYKDSLISFAEQHKIFIDASVDTGDISDNLSDESIRQEIRDEYLRDSTVTIVLVGTETKHRKHVDWEIYSSMYDGAINKKSGILVIELPTVSKDFITAPHGDAEKKLYTNVTWTSVNTKAEYERRYPYMPDRLIDNLLKPEARISVTPWSRVNSDMLPELIELAYINRANCEYDLRRPMRRQNS